MIFKEEDCHTLGFDICSLDLTLNQILDYYSYINHDQFCLSYLLTFRNFPSGSLGLAWTAVGEDGGVCDRHRPHTEVYQATVNKSLNTGVVTLSRNGRALSERVMALAFTHEVGHSFGSPHDNPSICGWNSQTDYLMSPHGSLGLEPNNMELSPCSVSRVFSILKYREDWVGCWTLSVPTSVCGNGLVEHGEECDCGSDTTLCSTLCCVSSSCTRTQGSLCSPTEGVCCQSSCQFSPQTLVCSPATQCSNPSLCTGQSAVCPPSTPHSQGQPCDGGARICSEGECTGTVCTSLGRLPCTNTQSNDSNAACSPQCQDKKGQCEVVRGVRYPEGEECRVGGGFGHCDGGVCTVGERRRWGVGGAVALGGCLVLGAVILYCYCAYCRNGPVRLIINR